MRAYGAINRSPHDNLLVNPPTLTLGTQGLSLLSTYANCVYPSGRAENLHFTIRADSTTVHLVISDYSITPHLN